MCPADKYRSFADENAATVCTAFGRAIALHHRSSPLCQIQSDVRHLSMSETTMRPNPRCAKCRRRATTRAPTRRSTRPRRRRAAHCPSSARASWSSRLRSEGRLEVVFTVKTPFTSESRSTVLQNVP
jgi:hypothetical protein